MLNESLRHVINITDYFVISGCENVTEIFTSLFRKYYSVQYKVICIIL